MIAGTRLDGRYLILSPLGQGGMATVYRALDEQLQRDVAIKMLSGRLSPDRRARLQREAELTASLKHPGVVDLHAVGEVEGRPFLVYELVEQARGLDEAFRGCDLRRRVAMVLEAATALGVAHRAGIVHRDVKPANILVDGDGRVRVADFGLARAVGQSRLTRTGAFAGTPTHMAPEQLEPRATAPGPTADVWALGVVLYEALTGELPFPGATLPELLDQILGARFERPRDVDGSIPVDLERVCLRALQQNPSARYPTAEELAADLNAWLEGRPLVARGRRKLGLGLGLGLAVAIGGVVATRSRPSPVALSPEPTSSTPVATPLEPRGDEVDLPSLLRAKNLVGVSGWLHDHRQDPQAERARSLLRRNVGVAIATLEFAHSRAVEVAWTDSERLVVAGAGSVEWWSLRGREAVSLAVHKLPEAGRARLAVADGAAYLIGTQSVSRLARPESPPQTLRAIAARRPYSVDCARRADGTLLLAVGSRDGVELYRGADDLVPWCKLETPPKTMGGITVAFQDGARSLWMGTFEHERTQLLRLMDLQVDPPQVLLDASSPSVARVMALSRRGPVLGFKGGAMSLLLRKEQEWRLFLGGDGRLFAHGGGIAWVGATAERVYSIAEFGELGTWGLESCQPAVPSFPLLPLEVSSAALSPDGGLLAIGYLTNGRVDIYLADAQFW